MKKHFSFLVLLIIATDLSYGQANTTLSNLTTPTAVNQNLSPDNNNTRNLGSTAKSWKTLYLDNNLYLKDTLFMHRRGIQNTFVGSQAGNSLTTGAYNTAGGYKSLYSNTTGNWNTAYGQYAMYLNPTGNQNTAIGSLTLYSNMSGYCNVALGQSSLYLNNGGFMNSGLGFETLFSNTTGNYNTASGAYALYFSNGSYNTASGYRALYLNTTGNYNTATGESSLYNNTSGSFNIASGNYSLYFNTTGSSNVTGGYKAGRNNSTGNNNVFIGWQAGYNNTDGSNNIYIGYNTGGTGSVDHISNTVAIGANVNTTQSNTIILGTNQNVGIGTTNPQYKLSVNGTIQAKELRVETGWSDYVFEKNYKLPSLENVAAYIQKNKHLPGINSAKDIQQNGLAVADMQTKMMAKIEELTLYIIQQNLQIQQLKEKVEQIEKQ